MDTFLRIDWEDAFGEKDINTQWTLFREKLSEASDIYIPKVTINKDNRIKIRHNLPINTKTKAKIKT